MRSMLEVFQRAKRYHRAWPELDVEYKTDCMCWALLDAADAKEILPVDAGYAQVMAFNTVRVEGAKRNKLSEFYLAEVLGVGRHSEAIKAYWESYFEKLRDFEEVHESFDFHLERLWERRIEGCTRRAVNHYIITKPRLEGESAEKYGLRLTDQFLHDLIFKTGNQYLDILINHYKVEVTNRT